jgi:hypothetical protein
VHSTSRRLEAAERQLDAATDLLLGMSFTAQVVRPVADHPAARPRPATVTDAVQGEVVEPGPMAHVGNDDVTGQYGTAESGIGDYGTGEYGTSDYGTSDYGSSDPRLAGRA